MEKRLTPGEHLAKQGIVMIAPFQDRMEQKGEEIETEHDRCEVLLAVTKIMLQMVPFGLKHIVIFVFDLPASTPCVGDGPDVVRAQAMIGDKAVVIQLFARFGIDDCDLEPMDRQGRVTPTQEDVVDVAHQRCFRVASIPPASFVLGHATRSLPAGPALVELGMGVGLARQDEVAPVVEDQRTKGLIAIEIIPQKGDAMGCYPRPMLGEPAFARRAFTVLFRLPVLRHDVLGGQSDDLRLAGADDHWGNGGVIIESVTIGQLAGETVAAMNGLGGKVMRPIQGHQELVIQAAKMRQHVVLFKALKDLEKHWIESAGSDRIEECADLIITGNLRYP